MVEVKSDKITRTEVIITHAKEIRTFLKEYRKKHPYPVGWETNLDNFIAESKRHLDSVVLEAYKAKVRSSTGTTKTGGAKK